MRSLVVVCLLVRAASSDPDIDWTGTYTQDGAGGGELCPHFDSGSTIDVANNAVTIDWKIRAADDSLVKVGTLEMTTRPSGLATLTPKLLSPMPRNALAALEQMSDTVAKLQALVPDLRLRFESLDHARKINMSTKVADCYAGWTAKAATASSVKAKPPVLKASSLAAGSSKWDTKYLSRGGYRDDWRCPAGNVYDRVTISKGRFSFPYIVKAAASNGNDYGEMTIGQVDVSVAASGAVTMRTSVTVDPLPPELTRGKPADEASPDYVRALTFTGTFTARGKGKYGHIQSGNKCDIYFETVSTFVPGSSVSFKKPMGEKCDSSDDCESDYCDSAKHCAKKD